MATPYVDLEEWGELPLPEIGETLNDQRFPALRGIVLARQDRFCFDRNLNGEDQCVGFVITTQ